MRLYITGAPGVGKTTFAGAKAAESGAGLLSLDDVILQGGKMPALEDDWDKIAAEVRAAMRRLEAMFPDNWIVEGAYSWPWIQEMMAIEFGAKILLLWRPQEARDQSRGRRIDWPYYGEWKAWGADLRRSSFDDMR